MSTIIQNYTTLCPPQSDSPLSIAASWVGIVTFITTTLGGLTIFYTIYRSFEKAQDDILEFGKAISMSVQELMADIETMEPMLQRLAHGHGPRTLESAMELVIQIRKLIGRLDADIKMGTPNNKGIRRTIGIYRLGRNPELANTLKEIQRRVPSLQAMKTNLVLMRLDEQDQILRKLAEALNIQEMHSTDTGTGTG
ncbi:hypothetical protein OIDMADRAFT_56985 [Oidiodendron maius Zn]|uniref:Uncharacterized protein n=1 Tax=Oidiodendron maius (strain Zn) TaxID=913774 RepID=A0A0C3CI62_OIDMZ|nr:hypothetical protein OIDMADRAFT_56985 [Oidiodendron maius Zn]